MKNTLKKSEIFGAIFVMVFGTLMHFFYDWWEESCSCFVCSVQRIHLGTLEAIVFPCFDLFGFPICVYRETIFGLSYRKTCRNRKWCIDDCNHFLHVYGGFQTFNSLD